jgi:cob(I)alamin adenosyltransferase
MRISKVITKTGDQGTTGLADGSRVPKTDPRICAIGDIDELNSFVGNAKSAARASEWEKELTEIQNDLLNLGGELSMPDGSISLLKIERIKALEKITEAMNESLPSLKEFILPEGDDFTTRIHLARAVCRRAERSVIHVIGTEGASLSIQYLNRLSDYLFVLARMSSKSEGTRERQWKK